MTYEYTNGIYPRRLVVTDKFEYAKKNYTNPNGEELEVSEGANATVYMANRKKLSRGDVLLVIHKPEVVETGLIAHEALHITRTILEWLPIPLTDDTEEAWAYCLEWAARCIQDFMNKLKK